MKPSKLGPLTCKQEASCQKLWGVFQLIPNLLTITKVNSKRSKNETNICSQAFVFLQLEYCNSLLSGHSLLSSWFKMQQLRRHHITPILAHLIWLSVRFRIDL